MGVKHKTTGDFSMPFLPQVHYKSYTECRLEQRGKGRLCLFCSKGLALQTQEPLAGWGCAGFSTS